MKRLALLLLTLAACHVTPLPVPHPEEWQPGYDVTDYPPLNVGASVGDAGADSRP